MSYPLLMKEILTLFEIVSISRLQFKMFLKTEFVFHRAENIVEKKNVGYQYFFLFPQYFLRAISYVFAVPH